MQLSRSLQLVYAHWIWRHCKLVRRNVDNSMLNNSDIQQVQHPRRSVSITRVQLAADRPIQLLFSFQPRHRHANRRRNCKHHHRVPLEMAARRLALRNAGSRLSLFVYNGLISMSTIMERSRWISMDGLEKEKDRAARGFSVLYSLTIHDDKKKQSDRKQIREVIWSLLSSETKRAARQPWSALDLLRQEWVWLAT